MTDSVFLSFHYERDCTRVQQVINMGMFDKGDQLLDANDWEKVRKTEGIKPWINRQMGKKSCVIVLTGHETARRELVQYEIERAWNTGKALFGVRINRLKSLTTGLQDPNGANPFSIFTTETEPKQRLDKLVPLYEPPVYSTSTEVYNWIKVNLPSWIAQAEVQARGRR